MKKVSSTIYNLVCLHSFHCCFVHSSKPVMDVLVMLCGEYHLNPSDHVMELVSPNENHIKFKPNSLIGSLDAKRVILRHRGEEERTKRKGPYMPEVGDVEGEERSLEICVRRLNK